MTLDDLTAMLVLMALALGAILYLLLTERS